MREVRTTDDWPESEIDTLRACLAAILELPTDAVPEPAGDEDVTGWRIMRWLGGLGLGLVPILDVGAFAWAGPWIAGVRPAGKYRARTAPARRRSHRGRDRRGNLPRRDRGARRRSPWPRRADVLEDGWIRIGDRVEAR